MIEILEILYDNNNNIGKLGFGIFRRISILVIIVIASQFLENG